MKDIEYPVRKPSLFDPCAQQIGRHRSEFRGLGHHAVACGKRGGHLPGEQVQGQIPWADARHHPQGFAQGVVDRLAFHGVAFACIVLHPRCVKTQVLLGAWDVYVCGKRHRLSIVSSLLLRQHGCVVTNRVRQSLQAGGPFSCGRFRPGGKSTLGGSHGLVHFHRARTRDGAKDLPGAWRHIFKNLRRVLECAIDKIQYLHD